MSKKKKPAGLSEAEVDSLKQAACETARRFVEAPTTPPGVRGMHGRDVAAHMELLREDRACLLILGSREVGVRDIVVACVKDDEVIWLHIFFLRDGIWRYLRCVPGDESRWQLHVRRPAVEQEPRSEGKSSTKRRRPRRRVTAH